MKCLIAAAVGLVLIGPVAEANAEAFLCVGQLSTGFGWADGKWQVRAFGVEDRVFVLQPGMADEYTVTRIGDAAPSHYCPALRPTDGSVRLLCGGLGNGFSFSSRTLRFQENYGIGYVDAANGSANMPYLLIGKCTKLDLRGILQE
ncbi:MAG: hypothetical protein ABWY13_19195 [Mesorhizobium sp.]|jgi:hypothetical protein|nr:hypothetical protein [Mesorhizobium sp.]